MALFAVLFDQVLDKTPATNVSLLCILPSPCIPYEIQMLGVLELLCNPSTSKVGCPGQVH